MAGKFEYKKFSEININDPFFTSLKKDYPGSATSTEFTRWFSNKVREGKKALVFEDENGIGAFVNLKSDETEEIHLTNGRILPPEPRVKITTIKIDSRFRRQRIGEGALGLTLWAWRNLKLDEIYVTVFEKHHDLTKLLEKYGFEYMGDNLNGEGVYLKDRRSLDFRDACRAFPFISGQMMHAGCLAIDMDYHDTMFAYSELANTLQEKVDISVANGLKKVYIGSSPKPAFEVNDPILIYRKYTGNHGKPGYKSVVTSYCVVTRVEQIKTKGMYLQTYNDYIKMVGNKSVFPESKLRELYNGRHSLTIIELLYCGYFGAGNNVNWRWLHDNQLWPDGHPMSFQYTKSQFESILQQGGIDTNNVFAY
jgi:RimJ/RimL family protein N-acetyltransferase